MDECGVAADEVNADSTCGLVNRARERHEFFRRARLTGDERGGRNRDALVGDAQPELIAYLVDHGDEARAR